MSRADDLRKGGARERGGAGGAGFVAWGDDYTWLEGELVGSFKTEYGLAVTMRVANVHERGVGVKGKDEEGRAFEERVSVGDEVNIGTQSASLNGKLTADDVGKHFHVSFDGWGESKGGRKFRAFTVIEMPEKRESVKSAAPGDAPNSWDGPEPADTHDYSQDEGPPFG